MSVQSPTRHTQYYSDYMLEGRNSCSLWREKTKCNVLSAQTVTDRCRRSQEKRQMGNPFTGSQVMCLIPLLWPHSPSLFSFISTDRSEEKQHLWSCPPGWCLDRTFCAQRCPHLAKLLTHSSVVSHQSFCSEACSSVVFWSSDLWVDHDLGSTSCCVSAVQPSTG